MNGRTVVIGAGLSGLAAARELARSGREVVVFEQNAEVGGRLKSQRVDGFLFDSGATSIAPLGQALERVILEELPTEDLVRIEKPVMAHDGFRVNSLGVMASNTPRYTYRSGTQHLVALLAQGLDVRLGQRVTCIEPTGDRAYVVQGEEFDAVVLSAPTPLTEPLLVTVGDFRRFTNVRFRACLSVMLGYPFPFDAPYNALVGPDQIHPLGWLSMESVKSPGRAPEGQTAIVAQMSAEYSRRRFGADDTLILEETLADTSRLLGKEFATPTTAKVDRYQYSHPETTTSFEVVNSPMSRLVVVGDALLGGRTELAFETGLRAARLLLENS